MNHYNKSLRANARKLRKEMTKEEKHLWYDFLKKLPLNVKSQKIVDNYIIDFYIPSAKTAIELDGRQHFTDENAQKDLERDEALNALGITVLRYTNDAINKNFSAVCNDILEKLGISYDEINV